MKRSRKRSEIRNLGAVLLFVLPALIPLFIFWIYPILRSVWLSFTDWDFMTADTATKSMCVNDMKTDLKK